MGFWTIKREMDFTSMRSLEIHMIDDLGNTETYNWQEAIQKVKQLNLEDYKGYSDWRLPNGGELFWIFNSNKSHKLYLSSFGYFWSNYELPSNREYAEGINFQRLETSTVYEVKYGREYYREEKVLTKLCKSDKHRMFIIRTVVNKTVYKPKQYHILSESQTKNLHNDQSYKGLYADRIYKTKDVRTPYTVVWVDGAKQGSAFREVKVSHSYEDIFEIIAFLNIDEKTELVESVKLRIPADELFGKTMKVIYKRIEESEAYFKSYDPGFFESIISKLDGRDHSLKLRDGVEIKINDFFFPNTKTIYWKTKIIPLEEYQTPIYYNNYNNLINKLPKRAQDYLDDRDIREW
ncbi:Lcl C-terminal domain-containing protein [Spirosoma pomorum]|jgi:hypothetical protein